MNRTSRSLTLRILPILLLLASGLFADNVRFTASVSKSQVATGEEFEVSFSVNSNADGFNPPSFNGFQVLGGPNVSSSMTSINGSMSASTTYSYYLMGVKEGNYTIGPASIVVNGRSYRTNVVRIKVVKGRPVPQVSTGSAPSAGDDDIAVSRPAKLANSLFLRAVVDKSKVYQGEQITLSYKLYTRVSIVASQLDKLPDLNGFWSEEIPNDNKNVEWKVETYKGQQYHVAVVKQSVLFPDHAGDLKIEPVEMTFVVRQQAPAKTLMDEFFGTYEDVKYKVKSLPAIVHVRPLPLNGKPADFNGAVGKFNIQAAVDKKELKANESLTYSLKITGSGNLKLLKAPDISFPPDFEKYDPKITDAITTQPSGVSGTRTYSYLTIPRNEGDFTIPPLRFTYFDPVSGKYETASAPPFKIKVNKGTGNGNVVYSYDQRDLKLLNKDIGYIKTDDSNLDLEDEDFYGSTLFYILLAAGPLLLAAAFIYRKRMEEQNSDPVLVRNRKAAKLAATHLASAERQLASSNAKAFYEELSRGLYGYLSHKLDIPPARLNAEAIVAALQSRHLDEVFVRDLKETLDLCEMARFAPVSGISAKEVFEKSRNIIYEFENKI